jgi:hypothetical protein
MVWSNPLQYVFILHLHDKTPSGSSVTKKRRYYLRDAKQFMTPHITKSGHQENNSAAPHTEEDPAFSGENEGDTQMNEAPNENVPESITPSASPTVLQACCCQSNQDDCKQRLLGKHRRLIALDAADTCFMCYMKQQTQSKTQTQIRIFAQSTPRHEINDCYAETYA